MKRALVSVTDKTGIVEFCKGLEELGYEVISTGGTKKVLDEAGVKTIGISDVTGFPEILGGRVKTLHPNVHGGLLAVRDSLSHQEQMKENNIEYIDLVCVNLYAFRKTVEKGCAFEEAIENIDIGGPSMLRSAAKNHKYVTVVTDAADYDKVLAEIKEYGNTTYETRLDLAAKVFRTTAQYDSMISQYLTQQAGVANPESMTLNYNLKQTLRYGENPHQAAALYAGAYTSYSIVHGKQLQGKELSYNNIQDGNACLNILKEFTEPTAVGLKHMNPCGVASAETIIEAWDKAYNADTTSIFGGIVAFNRPVTKELAKNIRDKKVFLEIIMAPSFDEDALEVLAKKTNLRLMEVDMETPFKENKQALTVNGGLLYQDLDNDIWNAEDLKVVTAKQPTAEEYEDLLFAMKCCKHVKSNAILVAKNKVAIGVGAGQMNRVGSAKIAMDWAKANGHTSMGLASDAFFPFDDTVRLANEYGVTAIIQPGGSIRDEDSIKACDELGISMVTTGMRHFKH
ncbi:MAG: bifunctional phosphoribosylaminoimidazolecarboxamide formyltransferase/IMP cyclohydrolase [Acholeplasmatales bacterium]|nr:bifunctional phosphoribosylaminoimidazolecarboxamide formyltransferase/IMP cyclohydrolase [Acholeplasmatales bacterium]